jgi:hypothetical protein
MIHKALKQLVEIIIKLGWFENQGKFKRGDWVRYNLFARISLWTIHRDENGTYVVRGFDRWDVKRGNPNLSGDNSCSSFWLRYANAWEKYVHVVFVHVRGSKYARVRLCWSVFNWLIGQPMWVCTIWHNTRGPVKRHGRQFGATKIMAYRMAEEDLRQQIARYGVFK